MTTTEQAGFDLPPRDHNNPPGPVVPETLIAKVQDHTDAAGAWLDLKAITDKDQAEKATDFVTGARKVWADLEAERKAQKKPHDDAGKAVQDLFTPLLAKVKAATDKVLDLQSKWMQAERDREEALRKEREAEAKRVADEAEKRAQEAEARNDISGMIDAQGQAKAAAKEVKAAAAPVKAQSGSSTGAGRTVSLRTYYSCVVDKRGPALSHYRDHPEVLELIERLANAEVRAQPKDAKSAPPGFRLIKEEKAA
ncbi:hypothetical protein [Pararhodobacter sp.]|uniref:hypothetical protein n=1 Tax=Pararhodobacter sp. TaxID=2127056 RepID=UPI002FDDB213